MREDMFFWLNGAGAVFKDPLPGSTNYLSAYDKEGVLHRQKEGLEKPARSDDEDESGDGEKSMPDDSVRGPSSSIPAETFEDMMPFPQNRQFRSQPVLSEEFKDEIWHQVVDLKKSVRAVSMDLNVEMSRVGAVVRLKAVEKQWVQQVRQVLLSFAVLAMAFYVMRNNSIGLKDKTTGYHKYYNSLITPVSTLLRKISTSLSRY